MPPGTGEVSNRRYQSLMSREEGEGKREEEEGPVYQGAGGGGGGGSNLGQTEEDQDRSTLGEKDRQMREEGEKRGVWALRGSLCCSLISGGQTKAGRREGPEGLLNWSPSCSICKLWVMRKYLFTSLSLCFLLDTMEWESRCHKIDMRLNEMVHMRCLRRGETLQSQWLVLWVIGYWCHSILG